MKVTILGGGLSSISLAYFLQNKDYISEINIIEKENECGGLCRTFETNSIQYDVGPHIIFSKDVEILDFMVDLLGENKQKHRRSNRVIYKDKHLQYPFENDLSKLDKEDIDYCVNTFLNNPYENYSPENMYQFFLKTFGDGITNLYLNPYNEKIWKFSPVFMDTQMVERIPKPPKEDIISSANGKTVDGYLHQLYFYYPLFGGTKSLIDAFISKFNKKVKIYNNSTVLKVEKNNGEFIVETEQKEVISSDKLVSTIPLNYFTKIYHSESIEENVKYVADELKYNSIAICIINVKKDLSGDNYAFMCADKNVIFHRISKLDFMGDNYHIDNTATYMIEVTYRKNDMYDNMQDTLLIDKIIDGMIKIKFIDNKNDVNFAEVKRFEYAYVIYDLNHRHNVDTLKNFFDSEGVYLNGRFGAFEYLNMDAVIRQSLNLSKDI